MVSDRLLDIFLEVVRLETHVDSIEIGAPSRGGCIKIYGSFDRPDEFRTKVDAALELRRYAQRGMAEGEAP